MNKLFLVGMLFSGAVMSQTVYFSNQYGQTTGSANTVGNTTYFSDQYGRSVGSANVVGNTTYFSDQYGRPMGSATNPNPSYNVNNNGYYGAQPNFRPSPWDR